MDITHNHQPLTFQRRHKKMAKLNLILSSPAVEAVSLSYIESKKHKKRRIVQNFHNFIHLLLG